MKVRVLIGCAALLLCLSDTAQARRRPAPPAESVTHDPCLRFRACREHVAQAAVLSNVDLWADALKEYQAAYALRQVPWLLFNIARVLQKLENPTEASQYYQRYLDESGDVQNEHIERARSYLAQAKQGATFAQPAMLPPPILPLIPVTSQQDPAPARVPLYKQGWVWGVASVVGAIVAVGIIEAAVAATYRDNNPVPSTWPTFRPFN